MTIKQSCQTLNLEFPEYYLSNFDKDILLDDAKSSYLKLIKANHPDLGGNHDKSVEIIGAFKFLQNNLRKKQLTITEQVGLQIQKEKGKNKNNIILNKICVNCNTEFTTLKTGQKRCSKCFNISNIRDSYNDMKCSYKSCNNIFKPRQKNHEFCSPECKMKSYYKDINEKSNCLQCGRPFIKKYYNQRFDSQKCKKKNWRLNHA